MDIEQRKRPENLSPRTLQSRKFYQRFWQWYGLDNPRKWPQWRLIEPLMSEKTKMLEIGAGLRPKIPLEGGYFVDTSTNALRVLKHFGAYSVQADFNKGVPFINDSFDLVCAFEVLEHLDEDKNALRDIARVLKSNGQALISFPLHSKLFSSYDAIVGHRRRYNLDEIEPLFRECGLEIEQYAGQDVPWPSGKVAKGFTFIAQKLPWVIPVSIKILDSLPSSAVRRPLNLKPWNFASAREELAKVSTGFFILKRHF